jgi:hypothetical protein
MNAKNLWTLSIRSALVVFCLLGTGCPEQGAQKSAPPPTPTTPTTPATEGATKTAPLVPQRQAADWCAEHVVPESICTRCNASLIDGFKAKKDWCNEHNLPESQCTTCHPDLKVKFEAMAPKQ